MFELEKKNKGKCLKRDETKKTCNIELLLLLLLLLLLFDINQQVKHLSERDILQNN